MMSGEAVHQVVIAVGGLGAIWLLERDRRLGWVLGLATAPSWLAATAAAGQWGMFGLSVAYTWVWLRGVWRRFLQPNRDGWLEFGWTWAPSLWDLGRKNLANCFRVGGWPLRWRFCLGPLEVRVYRRRRGGWDG